MERSFGPHIRCERGCSDCCHAVFGLFLIEAAHLKEQFEKLDTAVASLVKKPMIAIKKMAKEKTVSTSMEDATNALERGDWKKARRELKKARDEATSGGTKFLKQVEAKLSKLNEQVDSAEDQVTVRKRDARKRATPRKQLKAEAQEERKSRGLPASSLKAWSDSYSGVEPGTPAVPQLME